MMSAANDPNLLSREALDFAPDLLAMQERPPAKLPGVILYAVIALFAVLLAWAYLAKLDVVATADGKLIPKSYLKIVQPAEGGILKEILVNEGDKVQAGQVLMRMDAVLGEADTKILDSEVQQRQLQLRRIDAGLADRPLAMVAKDDANLFRQIQAQHAAQQLAYRDALAQERAMATRTREELSAAQQIERKLAQTLPSLKEQEDAWKKLGKEGFAGKLQVQEKERERMEKEQDFKAQRYTVESQRAAIAQSEQRMAQITSNYRQQLQNERVQIQAELSKLQQELAKQQHKNALQELKAPHAGVVKDVATHTIGTVVAPGTILMSLVPVDEPLMAEVMVKNDDVGFVRAGQSVRLKLAAYPFQKYGMVEGKITHIGADASDAPPNNGGAQQAMMPTTYKAIVTLDQQQLDVQGQRYPLTPGMQVSAEIHQGERTVLEYLVSPIKGVFQEAARER